MIENLDFLTNCRKTTDDHLMWLVGEVAKRHFSKFLVFKRQLVEERKLVDVMLRDMESMKRIEALYLKRIALLEEHNELLKRAAKIETGFDFDDKKEMH